MAKSPTRKTLEHLIKKVEALENQSFAQKLQIDELENKLSTAEETVRKMKEDPFGLGHLTTVPFVQPQQQITYTPNFHVCQPSLMGVSTGGQSSCAICGAVMNWPYNTTNTIVCQADPASQSSSDVEPILDLDISWILPDSDSTT